MATSRVSRLALAGMRRTISLPDRERLRTAIRDLRAYTIRGTHHVARAASAGIRNVLRKDEFDPLTVPDVVAALGGVLVAILAGLAIPWLLSRR